MQINISTRHGHLSQETQEKIKEKIAKLTRIFERLPSANVTIDLEHRDSPRVELRVSAAHHEDFVATDESSNVMSAVESALHKVEQQVRRHKEKLTGHRNQGLKHQEVPVDSESDTESDSEPE